MLEQFWVFGSGDAANAFKGSIQTHINNILSVAKNVRSVGYYISLTAAEMDNAENNNKDLLNGDFSWERLPENIQKGTLDVEQENNAKTNAGNTTTFGFDETNYEVKIIPPEEPEKNTTGADDDGKDDTGAPEKPAEQPTQDTTETAYNIEYADGVDPEYVRKRFEKCWNEYQFFDLRTLFKTRKDWFEYMKKELKDQSDAAKLKKYYWAIKEQWISGLDWSGLDKEELRNEINETSDKITELGANSLFGCYHV